MAVLATEQWSGTSFSKRPPWTAIRMFMVTGTADQDTATGSVPVSFNDAYPGRSFMLCDEISVAQRIGPQAFLVKCGYSVSERGKHFPQYTSLLNQPMRVQWANANVTETVDRDVDGNPLVNSALDPIPNATRTFGYKTLRVWRYEQGYDFAMAMEFENTVNDSDIVSSGITFPAGSLKCDSIVPMDEYDAEAEILRISYNFSCRLTGDSASYGIAPFQWRFLDAGRRGWHTVSGNDQPGEFIGPLGQAATDVRLNGNGVPIDSVWTVEGDTPVSLGTPAGATVEDVTNAVFLRYKRYRETNFGALGIF